VQLFCDATRASLKAANPDASFGELGKLMGQAWKAATPEEIAPFKAKHEVRLHP